MSLSIGVCKSLALLLATLWCTTACHAQQDAAYKQRRIIAMESNSTEFVAVVNAVCDPGTKAVPDASALGSDIYFRLTQRQYVFKEDKTTSKKIFNPESVLGGTPFVFLTVPQAGYGRDLYGIYSDLGYDAAEVLEQRDVEMVALVIRYKSDVKFSPETSRAPAATNASAAETTTDPIDEPDFQKYVYVPNWNTAFKLFARLASEQVQIDGKDQWKYFTKLSNGDRNMARFFPAEHREHIAALPYALLRSAGGADWDYRQMLENNMSMNSHFRGVGKTENTLSPADDREGLPEFVGPNLPLNQLQDWAVIDVGQMKFVETHETD